MVKVDIKNKRDKHLGTEGVCRDINTLLDIEEKILLTT
jgi:hypothetical protein